MPEPPVSAEEGDLSGATVRGIAWVSIGRVAAQLVQTVTVIALMRLLTPEDFGVMAMVIVFTGLATVVSSMGFSMGIIQAPEASPELLETAFWSVLAISLLMAGLVVLAAPAIESYYREPTLAGFTVWMAIHPVAQNLSLVPRAILRRQMRFGAASAAEVAGLVIGSGGAVILAFRGAGAFSLVFQLVVSHAVTALVASAILGWYPRFRWSRASAASLWAYGWAMTGFDVFSQLEGQLAPFLIGRYLGNTAVGFFSRGFSLLLGPVRLLGDTIWQVMFSALSLIQDDLERVRSAFYRAVALMIFVLAPAMVGTALVADALVPLVLGDQWGALIPVVQAMTVAALLSSAIGATYWLHTSQNTTGQLFSFGIVRFVVVALFVGGALPSGSIVTVAWAFAASQAVLLVLAYRLTRVLFDIGLFDLLGAVRGGLASSVAMGLVVWSVRPMLAEVPVGIDLGIRILVGVVVYVALGAVLARRAVQELWDIAARFGVGSARA